MSGRLSQDRPLVAPRVVACAHCGLAVSQALVQGGDERQFCCAACRQVFELIHSWGYDDYYRLIDPRRDKLAPAKIAGRAFEDFDDDSFQRELVEATDDGRVRTKLYLEGVHCAACVWLVERLPEALPGLDSLRLNFATSVAEVIWNPDSAALSEVGRALDSLGYTPHAHRANVARVVQRAEDRALLIKLGVAAACAMNIMLLHVALYAGEYSGIAPQYEAFFRWLSFGLALPVVLFSARPFYRSAWAGLKQRVPHMDLPIAIALTAAFAYSATSTITGVGPVYFDSLAALVALLLGARQVQRSAQRLALERADSLRDVAFVEFARRFVGEEPEALAVEVPLSALSCGDRVEVRAGELIPVDGTLLSTSGQDGHASLDNSILTGESTAVQISPGEQVYAGATNLGARLELRVDATGARTRVGALLALVEDAMSRRPPVVQLADRMSRVFVTVVLALAALSGLLWIGDSAGTALEHVIALLVVTCPCALGLATPVALSVGLTRAARAGIFIKNPEAIERLRRVDTVLLDKTGTLTKGRATVSDWYGDALALDLATALEGESSHPVARALCRNHQGSLVIARELKEVQEIPARGIGGLVDGHRLLVGSRELLRESGVVDEEATERHARGLLAKGLSPVYVAVDGVMAGVAGVGDPIRDDAAATIEAMKRRGLGLKILSGDHPAIVAHIADALGIPRADAEGAMSPEDKRDRVAALCGDRSGARKAGGAGGAGGAIVMVGDGVNDAAAMALADVGVAVHGGAGASILAADVVLTREGLGSLLGLLGGSRRLLMVVWRNLGFSLVYNLIGAGLALVGLVGPLLAAALMPISSLTVILSSALSRTFTAPRRVPPLEKTGGGR